MAKTPEKWTLEIEEIKPQLKIADNGRQNATEDFQFFEPMITAGPTSDIITGRVVAKPSAATGGQKAISSRIADRHRPMSSRWRKTDTVPVLRHTMRQDRKSSCGRCPLGETTVKSNTRPSGTAPARRGALAMLPQRPRLIRSNAVGGGAVIVTAD